MKMAVKNELNTTKRKAAQAVKFCVKQERNATLKKVYAVLKKTEVERSEEEKQFLFNYIDLVKEVRRRIERQKKLKERLKEVEDPPDMVIKKCAVLAEALSACRRLVVYTGAGVSTSACIPDYRGSNGIWTLLQQGKDIGLHDLSKAEPTLTHMALTQLYRVGLVKHIVSQNCDGLHLRSGLPREALSEVHGNMYIEVCRQCQPVKEYLRLFDVTENTARFNHKTGRRCYACSGSLTDSIVHFGERGTLKWPLNWPGAVAASASADAILCIGSSLKVLKRYPWLWGMDKHPKKRPKLYIVNLQWTPKDSHSVLKINARCDFVMEQVMHLLHIDIPSYNRSMDPIFPHATSLHPAEKHTTTKPLLMVPDNKYKECCVKLCSPDKEFGASNSLFKLEKQHLNNSINCKCEDQLKSRENFSDTSQIVKPVTPTSSVSDIISQVMVVKTEVSHSPVVFGKSHKLLVNAENLDTDVKTSDLSDKSSAVLHGNSLHSYCDSKMDAHMHGESTPIKQELLTESESSDEPFMEIIYEGVKLKVEDNVSVEANVRINNDMVILCDMPSIHCNSFLFNSSYELEESENNFKFVNINNRNDFNESENQYSDEFDSDLIHNENEVNTNEEIVAHSPTKKLFVLNPSEHNYSHMSSASDCTTRNQAQVSCATQSKRKVQKKSMSTPCRDEKPRKCLCCASWFAASECLFYLPKEPLFRDPSAAICECCSDGSEEEEEEEEEEEAADDCEKKENKDEVSSPAKPASNPGWYGKGYRKRIKKKR